MTNSTLAVGHRYDSPYYKYKIIFYAFNPGGLSVYHQFFDYYGSRGIFNSINFVHDDSYRPIYYSNACAIVDNPWVKSD